MSTMVIPPTSMPITSTAMIQCSAFATLPQRVESLLALTCPALAYAFDLEPDVDVVADFRQQLFHAECAALDRRRGTEAGDVLQRILVCRRAIEGHVERDRPG